MDFRALQREAHAIAKDHGWWDTERTFGDLISDIHEGLSEARKAYRDEVLPSKPHLLSTKVACELADVVIRVADMAEFYGVDLAGYRLTAGFSAWSGRESFGEWLGEAHGMLSQAFETFYAETKYNSGWRTVSQRLADIILCAERMAAHYGIDLDAAIEAKLEYNRTRPYRHGGKAL